MLLTVDVGNTQTVIGVYEGEHLRAMWRLSSDGRDTPDELCIALASLFDLASLKLESVSTAALASVVPQLSDGWVRALRQIIHHAPLICTAKSAGHLLKTTYPHPEEIGADRIADTIAALGIYGAPVVVVDFGTATNIEVIDRDGQFLGGILAPGIQTGASALFSHGAQLAAVNLNEPVSQVVGRSTAEAIRSGLIVGEVARVDGLVRRIFDELGYKAPVVATGGLAHLIAHLSETITDINEELTLEGLRLFALSSEAGQ